MADRLTPIDNSFLSLEEGNTPLHVGNVLVFDAPSSGFDHDALVGHIEQRLAYAFSVCFPDFLPIFPARRLGGGHDG